MTEHTPPSVTRRVISCACFATAIVLTIASCQAEPKENFFVPGAVQLLSDRGDRSYADDRSALELRGLVARSVEANVDTVRNRDQAERNNITFHAVEMRDDQIDHYAVKDRAFAITTLPESRDSLMDYFDSRAELTEYGSNPLVLVTSVDTAQQLAERSVAQPRGEDIYQVDVAELIELAGEDESALSITAPDSSSDLFGLKWAQTVALAVHGATQFPSKDEAEQWAEHPAVHNIDIDPELSSHDLARHIGSNAGTRAGEIVVTSENDASEARAASRESVAVLYPDIQLGTQINFISIREEGKKFRDRLSPAGNLPPFHIDLRGHFSRYRDIDGQEVTPYNLTFDTGFSPTISDIGDPDAVFGFNYTLSRSARQEMTQ